jgi:uncharacterized protein YecE (DUF72 family)
VGGQRSRRLPVQPQDPREVTHLRRLQGCDERLASFVDASALRYEEGVTRPFFGRVAADPPRTEVDAEPDGWRSHAYFRLHGSPRTYISAYDDGFLDALARRASATPARSG